MPARYGTHVSFRKIRIHHSETSDEVSKMLRWTFKEKPDEETARRIHQKGALWNGGVFAFRFGIFWIKRMN